MCPPSYQHNGFVTTHAFGRIMYMYTRTYYKVYNGLFCHPTTKFTMDYSDTTINFLDVSVTKNSTKLSTDLFTKDTDSHQYLHATSCHPYSCKKSIPYGQTIRIKRICSDPEQLKLRLEDLSNWLVNRGYKQEIVSQQIHRVDAIDRETLPIKHPKQNNMEALTLILTYHHALKNVHEILREAHRHTLKSPRLQYVYTKSCFLK